MATFISTLRFTGQGVKAVNQTTQRAASLKSAAEKMGVEVKSVYWTLGNYDGVLIFEAPDDATATAMLLYLGSLGNLQSNTLRAFNADEIDQILTKLPG